MGIGLSVIGGGTGAHSAGGSKPVSPGADVIFLSYGYDNYVHWLTKWRIVRYHKNCIDKTLWSNGCGIRQADRGEE